MGSFVRILVAFLFSAGALGFTAASADHRDGRPSYCARDHDHRSHAANYYDYYDHDRYYRAGAYRGSGASLTISVGDRYDDRSYGGRYDDHRFDGRRRGGSQVVKRRTYDTRYRASIVLVEEAFYGRRGRPTLVCTLDVRGPEARYVSRQQVRAIARSECSHRARIRYA